MQATPSVIIATRNSVGIFFFRLYGQCLLCMSLCCLPAQLYAQTENTTTEQQLENLSEADDAETEDDSFLQQYQYYRNHPLNLNEVGEEELKQLAWLNELQIQSLIRYRQLLGPLISMYELQAVPGWSLDLIGKTLPFVTISSAMPLQQDLRKRLWGGQHSLLMRSSQVLEKSKGYVQDSAGHTKYSGSRQRMFFRYQYQYKNLLQYGMLGEKDAGESFLKGKQQAGFDFYSMHLFARNLGAIKRLALGDFTVNLGQGLLTYQSLSFRKSSDVMNIKRQAEIFRPYHSAGEFNFHRGVALTLQQQHWQLSAFASFKKISANPVTDSLSGEEYVSSLLSSGYHRTDAENAGKNSMTQTALGGSMRYKNGVLQLGLNAVHYSLEKPLIKTDEPYNDFAFRGDKLSAASIDYAYTYRNLHAFGEAAISDNGALAQVHGLMASVDRKVDVAVLYRSISNDYHSLYGNAFTESTAPANEKGLYMGASIKANAAIRLSIYADVYSFPWLRYRVSRPSQGADYVAQLSWNPAKQVELYTRLHAESKAINASDAEATLPQTSNIPRTNWRTHLSYKLSPAFTLRTRAEVVWYNYKGPQAEQGFLMFADVLYKPMLKPLALGCRLQYFETDGYNSRLYAYENDVLYSFSIPPFFGKGYRYYLNLNYDMNKALSFWLRLAQSFYPGAAAIGSGNDEIPGPRKTEYKLQVRFEF